MSTPIEQKEKSEKKQERKKWLRNGKMVEMVVVVVVVVVVVKWREDADDPVRNSACPNVWSWVVDFLGVRGGGRGENIASSRYWYTSIYY